MKQFKVTAELFMCAERVETIIVKSNSERKAKNIAKEKLIKKYNTDMVRIITILEIGNLS